MSARSAAPRTRPWARNGARAGIPSASRRRHADERVLVVGAGPAGLEAARALGQRGYEVHLAEATRELGGRVSRGGAPARPAGMGAGARLAGRPDRQDAQCRRYIAKAGWAPTTCSSSAPRGWCWRPAAAGDATASDAATRALFSATRTTTASDTVFTPERLMDGARPPGPVVIFDDDGYYMGGVLAELLRKAGREVTLVTPADNPSPWTVNTLEYNAIQRRLRELGVRIVANHTVAAFEAGTAVMEDIWTGQRREEACGSLVAVTSRLPEDALFQALTARRGEWAGAGVVSVDCHRRRPGAGRHRARRLRRPPLCPRARRAPRRHPLPPPRRAGRLMARGPTLTAKRAGSPLARGAEAAVISEREAVLHSWCVQRDWDAPTVTGGQGAWFFDAEGRRYLDMSSLSECSNLGHQHPRVVQAIRDQAETLCFVTNAWGAEPRAAPRRAAAGDIGVRRRPGLLHPGRGRRQRARGEDRPPGARPAARPRGDPRARLSRRLLCRDGAVGRRTVLGARSTPPPSTWPTPRRPTPTAAPSSRPIPRPAPNAPPPTSPT